MGDRNSGFGEEEYVKDLPPPQVGVRLVGGGGGHNKSLHLRAQSSGWSTDPWIGLVFVSDGTGEFKGLGSGQRYDIRMHIRASEFQQWLDKATQFVQAARKGHVQQEEV